MKKIAALLVLFVLSACSWRSPNSSFYVMKSADLQPISEKKINVLVERVKVPDMLDRAQMVINDKDSSKIQVLEFERWGEVYSDIIQSTVTDDLIAYLPNAYVKRTYSDGDATMYAVNIEVNKIKAYKEDKVILSVWWNIRDTKGKIVGRKQGRYEAKVHGDDIQDLVNAQAETVHQMSRDIADALISK